MYRAAVFAHYDKDNKIQDYVLFYLKELQKYFDKIIFVSDGNLTRQELEKIENISDKSIIGKHYEYDFGSYKRGFLELLKNYEIEKFDEIAFINDSCYGPLFDLSHVFNKMDKQNFDFWGLTAGHTPSQGINSKHIQSYFVILRKNVFKSDAFFNFIRSVKKEENKMDVVKNYEYGLTSILEGAGFCWDAYSDISKILCDSYLYHYKEMIIAESFPLLKRSIPLKKEANFINLKEIKNVIQEYTTYNYDYIEKDILYNKTKLNIKNKINFTLSYIKRHLANCYWDYIFIKQAENTDVSEKIIEILKQRKQQINIIKRVISQFYWNIIRPLYISYIKFSCKKI